MFYEINELAILVAAILSVAVGSIWYSPFLFGKQWLQAAGLTLADENISSKEAFIIAAKGVFIQSLFFVVVSQFIAITETDFKSLCILGVSLAILLFTYLVSVVVWEKKSVTYLCIHAGYGTLALFIGISIIAFWPW